MGDYVQRHCTRDRAAGLIFIVGWVRWTLSAALRADTVRSAARIFGGQDRQRRHRPGLALISHTWGAESHVTTRSSISLGGRSEQSPFPRQELASGRDRSRALV